MAAAAGVRTENDEAVRQALAALDPGPFGQVSEAPGTVRCSRMFDAERRLEEALAIFEHLDERGLCDDTEQLIEQVKERLAADQKDHDDKEEAA